MLDKTFPSEKPALVRRAVVLAGGKGTRLRPFTFAFPKPLLPIGETPIIDIVMRQLQASGVQRVTLAVGHLAELLMAYFANRHYQGMTIDYSREERPLGTAGPLALVDGLNEPFFVLNGDLLTSLDFADLARRHVESKAQATIASYGKSYQVDLGILELNERGELSAYREKPTHYYKVSMGIYVFEPEIVKLLRGGEPCDLPDLVARILESQRRLFVYPFDGYWVDIGTPGEYARAVEEFEGIKATLFRGHA
ncbi:MAG: NTP transferase domain-containing protein [Candidatus Tectomicrobia bacterium]|uniref:NTP transferase domain-containing protein n=1 Tax=Tectimicrobiota bacterium TaxID=2528274 RepID=A0A932ML00_UNCTE|nr:NTP transferase domain-containing protein [Candidatus Tectomicrobia bacterium]